MRPTFTEIDVCALKHNVNRVRYFRPHQHVIAMVKANAYGCGLDLVVPAIEKAVDYFGVASLEEGVALRELSQRPCILFEGVYQLEEYLTASELQLECVIHHAQQLHWLLSRPLEKSLRIWVKVNTGMNRLGFLQDNVAAVLSALAQCACVQPNIGLLTHLACADEPDHPQNAAQVAAFHALQLPPCDLTRSIGNSAAVLSRDDAKEEVVRPGLMLYGVSPFAHRLAHEFGLKPVMRFLSGIIAVQHCAPGEHVGYGGSWRCEVASRIGVVAVGYGDGYPRHVPHGTPTWVNGQMAPVVGRVSMDMLTIDLTACPGVDVGMQVELWGERVPVETIARAAGTSAYELICQVTSRVSRVRALNRMSSEELREV